HQATAWVQEPYLGRVGGDQPQDWTGRGHFSAAAAEAMRRILVDNARRKQTEKHGGDRMRVELPGDVAAPKGVSNDLLALDDALAALGRHDPNAARLVTLPYFAGPSHQDAAAPRGLGRAPAHRLWALARAWLYRRLTK